MALENASGLYLSLGEHTETPIIQVPAKQNDEAPKLKNGLDANFAFDILGIGAWASGSSEPVAAQRRDFELTGTQRIDLESVMSLVVRKSLDPWSVYTMRTGQDNTRAIRSVL